MRDVSSLASQHGHWAKDVVVNVDIDWMDPEFIKSLPMKPYDQTSNQLWMGIQLAHAANRDILEQTARELLCQGWLAVYTKMVCALWLSRTFM
jgi:hypothetical protein